MKTYRSKRPSQHLVCPVCQSEFTRFASQLRLINYCSGTCRNQALFAGPGNANWKGGTYVQRGYRFVQTSTGEYVQEHRLVAEKTLGRPLLPKEQVHHLNHNKLDNAPENLAVMSASEHQGQHKVTRGVLVTDWTARGHPCLECGGTERPHNAHGLCTLCYNRSRRTQNIQSS